MTEGIQFGRIMAGHAHAPVVYFLLLHFSDRRPAVKIGTSAQLKRRIETISYSATLSDVLLLVPGGRDIEAAYHQRFRQYRLRGELYRMDGELEAFLASCPDGSESGAQLTIREAVANGVFGYEQGALAVCAARKRVHRAGIKPARVLDDGSYVFDRAVLAAVARDGRRKEAS